MAKHPDAKEDMKLMARMGKEGGGSHLSKAHHHLSKAHHHLSQHGKSPKMSAHYPGKK